MSGKVMLISTLADLDIGIGDPGEKNTKGAVRP
jgi:hypothetical protein